MQKTPIISGCPYISWWEETFTEFLFTSCLCFFSENKMITDHILAKKGQRWRESLLIQIQCGIHENLYVQLLGKGLNSFTHEQFFDMSQIVWKKELNI